MVRFSAAMRKRLEETRAFRATHGETVPALIEAEDDDRNGGKVEAFQAAIGTASRERTGLEVPLRRFFAWACCA
ncbi:MAG TPA: hypothetical protein VGN91_21840 [Bosea sp. (in: a-proteobacteria)]|jgi:hypothetical protein|nr:hypothetical protein [Bosea sp. (in: a-proteobacteria)]